MSDFLDHPTTPDEFFTQLFFYRLHVYTATRRYAVEVQALDQLKRKYDGVVPQPIWDEQRRRVFRAKVQLDVHHATLRVFLELRRN